MRNHMVQKRSSLNTNEGIEADVSFDDKSKRVHSLYLLPRTSKLLV